MNTRKITVHGRKNTVAVRTTNKIEYKGVKRGKNEWEVSTDEEMDES